MYANTVFGETDNAENWFSWKVGDPEGWEFIFQLKSKYLTLFINLNTYKRNQNLVDKGPQQDCNWECH